MLSKALKKVGYPAAMDWYHYTTNVLAASAAMAGAFAVAAMVMAGLALGAVADRLLRLAGIRERR